MYSRTFIAVILFPLLGSFAHAGVITGIDWEQRGSTVAVQSQQAPSDEPIRLERGEQTENGMAAPSLSVSVSTSSAILPTVGLFAPACVTGTIVNSDLSPPTPPLLDGIIRPA